MATRTKENPAEHLIKLACDRDTPVEIHCESPDGSLTSHRTRMLELRDDRIILETLSKEGIAAISSQKTISVHMLLGGMRYRFESTLIETCLFSRINNRVRVRAIAIQIPSEVREDQRRTHYRLSLASGEPIVSEFIEPHASYRYACPVRATRVVCRLVDISAGGASCLVERRHAAGFALGKCYYMAFFLPDVDMEFNMFCEIRHIREIKASESLRMGIAFQPWSGGDLKSSQLDITQFIAIHERKQLRRRK